MRNRRVVIIEKLVCFETSNLSFAPLKFKNPSPYALRISIKIRVRNLRESSQ